LKATVSSVWIPKYEGTEGENFKDEDIWEEDSESRISAFSSFHDIHPKQIL